MFEEWRSLATSPASSSDGGTQHLLGVYGDTESWALMYNLYADKLLGLGMIPQSVREMNDPTFYNTLINAPY